MNKYQNGKIYKLVNTEGTLTYIGSTTQSLAKRKSNHHESYKCWKNGKGNFVTAYKIFDDDEDGYYDGDDHHKIMSNKYYINDASTCQEIPNINKMNDIYVCRKTM